MSKSIRNYKTPKSNKTSISSEQPKSTDIVSWRFSKCDSEKWQLFGDSSSDDFINEIIPFLRNMEGYSWSYWLTQRKKKCHEIDPDDLEKSAKDRLIDMEIEAEKILVMHLENTHCLYGYIQSGICYLLWYDKNHGDNDDCVCRSFKKGDKKKHNR